MNTAGKPPIYVRHHQIHRMPAATSSMGGGELQPWTLLSLPIRLFAGGSVSMICIALAIIIPLWPITMPLFLFLALGAPFVFLGYHATGWCPACGQEFATRKRAGGIRCAGCGCGLAIRNGRVFRV